MFKRVHTKEIQKNLDISLGERSEILQSRSMEENKLRKVLEEDENEEKIIQQKIVKMESKIYVELINANNK